LEFRRVLFRSSFSKDVGAPKLKPFCKAAVTLSRTFSLLCPKIRGPQEQQKSINSLPSASQILQPSPFSINKGTPCTDLKALTGEFTPPGKYCLAFSYKRADFSREISGFDWP